ncbi:MAG: ribonuclease HII [Rickettsiales bacterium]|nr:ribonuclease HII [Rickettsiales bacterium]
MTPTLHISYEQSFAGPVCGVDEAGRGPLAGPVVAGAVILNPLSVPAGLNDSKKLSVTQRARLYEQLQQHATCRIGIASVEEIDRLNILRASLLAMQRAVESLPQFQLLGMALIDGNQRPNLSCPLTTIVKGDAHCLSIAAASIIAKVTRDRMMREYATQYPQYGFDQHAGYGTEKHLAAIAEHGITPIHRRSFAPIKHYAMLAA